MVISIKPGNDIVVLQWQRGFAFLINNTECKTLRIVDKNGLHDIEIDRYPYLWYNEEIPSNYTFLDENGNEIT